MRKIILLLTILCGAALAGHGLLSYAAFSDRSPAEASPQIPDASVIMSGKASWYSERDPGVRRHTADNEIFNDSALTCAMWDVPFNQRIRVTNLANGKTVIVRVNDRGPHRRYVAKGRIIDLTKGAFEKIAALHSGLIHVKLELLN